MTRKAGTVTRYPDKTGYAKNNVVTLTATHWTFDGSEFWSFDDEQSLGWKAGYVNQNHGTYGPLRGVMFWELSGDRDRRSPAEGAASEPGRGHPATVTIESTAREWLMSPRAPQF